MIDSSKPSEVETSTPKQLEPGRELDALVAGRVMGWHSIHGIWCQSNGEGTGFINADITGPAYQYALMGITFGDNTPQETIDMIVAARVWKPSTDIAAAWEVIGHLVKDGSEFNFHYSDIGAIENGKGWTVHLDYTGARASTLPHAICLAALAAIEQGQKGQ